jgi:RND superfamily putative drug exporter
LLGNEVQLAVLHSPTLRAADPAFRAAVEASTRALAGCPGISGVIPLPAAGDPDPPPLLVEELAPLGLLSHDEHTVYMVVGTVGADRLRQDQAPAQRAAADGAARAASGGAVTAYLLGASPFGQAAQQVEVSDLGRIELVGVPLAMLVLLLGLRAPVAAAIPMVVAGAAVLATLGLFALWSGAFQVDGMLVIGVSAVGLGAGVDYALFVVSRFRDELASGAAVESAVARALTTSGRTALYSGLIVALASASLFLVRWHVFTEFAVGMMAVVAACVAATLTLLPALLASAAGRVEWRPRWMWRPSAIGRDRLARWARHLMRRPWPYIVGVTAGLVLLASPATGLALGINLERPALADTPFGRGQAVLERDVPGYAGLVELVVRHPAQPGLAGLLEALRADSEVSAAVALDNHAGLTFVAVIPRQPGDTPAVVQLVHRVREAIVPATLPPGADVSVGGIGAMAADIASEVRGRAWQVVGVVLGLMFALLVWMLRSVLVPVKAIAMNLLATASAIGVTTWVFRPSPDSEAIVWPHVPLVVFVLLFALSMDYELFLVRRIQEEYQASGDNTSAVAAGLQRTARPIALAAAILAVSFGSLLMSELSALRQLGFAIPVALVIDATLIRLVLVPALMQIMGRSNWWLPSFRRSAAKPRDVRQEPIVSQGE